MSKASQRRLAEKQKRLKAGGGSEIERIIHSVEQHRKNRRSLLDDVPYWMAVGKLPGHKKPDPHPDDAFADQILLAHEPHVKALERMQRRLNIDVGFESDTWISMPGVVASGMEPGKMQGATAFSVFGQVDAVLDDLQGELVRRLEDFENYGLWVVGVQGALKTAMAAIAFTRSGAMKARVYSANGSVAIEAPSALLAFLRKQAQEDPVREENQSRETLAVEDGLVRLASLFKDGGIDPESVGAFLGEVLRNVLDDGEFEYAACLWAAAEVMVVEERMRREEQTRAVAEAVDKGKAALGVAQAEIARLKHLLDKAREREAAKAVPTVREAGRTDKNVGTARPATLAERLAPFF